MGLLRQKTAIDDHVVSLTAPGSLGAEQYRRLRYTVEELAATRGFRVIAVTSAVASDGKTLTAVNLAGALARPRQARVLLVDADLRQPAVARRLGVRPEAGKGVVAALESAPGASIVQFAQSVEGSRLSVLTVDRSHPEPYELLSGARVRTLLDEARTIFDFVIVDTPPVVPVPDSGLIRRAVDGYLVVVGARSTPRRLVGEALSLLEPTSVVGLVYNRDPRPFFGYYRSRYRRYFREYVKAVDGGASA